MKIIKYRIPIVVYTIFCIFNVILFIVGEMLLPWLADQDLSYFLPFTGLALELLFAFFILWPIMAFIGGVLGAFLAPMLLGLHKKTLGRNMIYGIEQVYRSDKFKGLFRGFFPGLMAINFSLLLSDYTIIQDIMVTPMVKYIATMAFADPQTYFKMICFVVLITITLIISYCLFSALWVLNDSGIVFSNKPLVEKRRTQKPQVGESIGGGYKYVLKGYAGIAVIVSYYELMFLFFNIGILGAGGPMSDFINIYLFLLYFILLPLFTLPSVILLDVLRDWRCKFIKKYATKLGIIDEVEIEFKKINK